MTARVVPIQRPADDVMERVELAPGFTVSRITTGLRRVSGMEHNGEVLEPELTSAALGQYLDAGLTTFAMADNGGPTEANARGFEGHHAGGTDAQLLATWVPEPGLITFETVRAAVQRLLDGVGVERIDLLQFDAWSYADPAWLDCLFWLQDLKDEGLIRHLGLRNFDTAHLRIALTSGIDVVSNQVSYSLVDQRARGGMTNLCLEHGIKLLVFGTVAGGFLTERWLGAPRPEPEDLTTCGEAKYWRFVQAAGGWDAFQHVLECLARVSKRHKVSIADLWVNQLQAVGLLPRECVRFVGLHEPGVPDHVGNEYGGEPALDAFLGHVEIR